MHFLVLKQIQVQNLIKLLMFFCEIFWTADGRVSTFRELSLLVLRHVLAKIHDFLSIAYIGVLEVESLKITAKRLFPAVFSQLGS